VTQLHLGTLAHLRSDPFRRSDALEIVERGALLVNGDGRFGFVGERSAGVKAFPEAERVDHGDAWILPGMVDGHSHFPQHYATASSGGQLLDWLEKYIFPAEAALADPALAEPMADRYVRHLLTSGTTTAMVFGSQFLPANLALFHAAQAQGLRLISGMTLMDLGGLPVLRQSPQQAWESAETLIGLCEDQALLHFAITPRFALSCSPAMLETCGQLRKRYPQTYLQTHINENLAEIDAVARAFPECRDYLDVYDGFGLIGNKTVLAHDIHVTDPQLRRMKAAGSSVCHCPCSNLFLGSGLFPMTRHIDHGIPIAVGTDIGAGRNFSMLAELGECHDVQQLLENPLDAARLLYLGTLGGAAALRLETETGNFETGKSADFLVLDWRDGAYLEERLRRCHTREDQLFCLLLLGERHIDQVYVRGRCVHGARSGH
jgi:guanine deaminase